MTLVINRLTFAMPVLMPGLKSYPKTKKKWDSQLSNWAGYLKQVKADNTVNNTINAQGIKVALDSFVAPILYAMVPGVVCYLRVGDRINDGAFSYTATKSTLILKRGPSAKMSKMSQVMALPNYIIYEGIDAVKLKQMLLKVDSFLNRQLDSYVAKQLYLILRKRSLLHLGSSYSPDFKRKLSQKIKKRLRDKMIKLFIPKTTGPRNQFITLKVDTGDDLGEFKSEMGLRFVKVVKQKNNKLIAEYLQSTQVFKTFASLEGRLEKHPLVVWSLKQKEEIKFYFRFEYWNEALKKYSPVNWQPNIDVMRNNGVPVLPQSKSLDNHGFVSIFIPKEKYQEVLHQPLYFVLDLNEHQIGSKKFPKKWQSISKFSVSGVPGSFNQFKGVNLGLKTKPVVFRIGTRIHGQLFHQDDYRKKFDDRVKENNAKYPGVTIVRYAGLTLKSKKHYGKLRRFPAGIKVGFKLPSQPTFNYLRTDSDGAFDYWTTEDLTGDVDLTLYGDMKDSSIGLEPVVIIPKCIDASDIKKPKSIQWKFSLKISKLLHEAMGVDLKKPQRIKIPQSNKYDMFRNAIFTLKEIREIHQWLRYMTKSSASKTPLWKAKPLFVGLFRKPGVTSHQSVKASDIIINLNVNSDKLVGLGTISHEYGHYVMSVAWNSNENVWSRVARKLGFRPHSQTVINELTALVEGWAPFFSLVFDYKRYETPPRKFNYKRNAGEKIEDAVAHAFFDLYQHEVLPKSIKVKTMGDSENGDIKTIPKTYCNGQNYYPFFNQLLWVPFTQIGPYYHSWVTAPPKIGIRQFCQNIKDIPANQNLWNLKLRRHFHRRNIVRDL